MNHGIFMTPGVEEEWTLSVAHTDEDLQVYLDAFEAFARDVTGELGRSPADGGQGPRSGCTAPSGRPNCERVGLALAYKGDSEAAARS